MLGALIPGSIEQGRQVKPVSKPDEFSKLRQEASDLLGQLTASERESLLIKCWMSHDARWFMSVAAEFGMAVANRLNQIAAHGVGEVEASRIARALQLPPVNSVDDYLLIQEIFITLLGPDLLDYEVKKTSDHSLQMRVCRCFAHENVTRAGIADQYECGILARVTGWLDALDLEHELEPSLGKCLKVQGQECIYKIAFNSIGSRSTASVDNHVA